MKNQNNISFAPAMTDAEVKAAFWSSGIPAIYHNKELSLQSMQISEAAAAAEWAGNSKQSAAKGSCASITFDGREGLDLTYLMARAMVLKGSAVAVMSLPILAEVTTNRFALRNADRLEDMHSRDYLIVIGALGSGQAPYPDERMFEVEWSMKSWILSGKPLVLQGSESMRSCRWWSKGFADFFLSHQTHTFGESRAKTISAIESSAKDTRAAGGRKA